MSTDPTRMRFECRRCGCGRVKAVAQALWDTTLQQWIVIGKRVGSITCTRCGATDWDVRPVPIETTTEEER